MIGMMKEVLCEPCHSVVARPRVIYELSAFLWVTFSAPSRAEQRRTALAILGSQ